jgi:transposase
VQHGSKNVYSLGLRRKCVEAKERGMSTIEVIRNFRVGHSCVKRYAKTAREGSSLRQRRNPGSRPKAEERARRLLETDLHECPAVILSERREFLERVAGAGE